MCVHANTCIIDLIVYSPVHIKGCTVLVLTLLFLTTLKERGLIFKVKFFKLKFCHVTLYYKSTLSTRAILWQLVYLQSF